MKKSEIDQCCHESRADIPWLLNGTLSDSATAALREHLKSCRDCRADFESHEQLRTAVLGDEVTPLMPATTAEDVIGVVRTGHSQHSRSGHRRSQAIAASIAILAVALVLLFYLEKGGEGSNQLFETATSAGSPGGIDYVLQLQFEGSVTNQEKGRIVAQLEDVVKWTVSENGDYEVHVQLTAPSLTVLEDYEAHTAALAGVRSAKFTALQLPVR